MDQRFGADVLISGRKEVLLGSSIGGKDVLSGSFIIGKRNISATHTKNEECDSHNQCTAALNGRLGNTL